MKIALALGVIGAAAAVYVLYQYDLVIEQRQSERERLERLHRHNERVMTIPVALSTPPTGEWLDRLLDRAFNGGAA